LFFSREKEKYILVASWKEEHLKWKEGRSQNERGLGVGDGAKVVWSFHACSSPTYVCELQFIARRLAAF
jgi:hypothetical protein